jgi:hypothetical protein
VHKIFEGIGHICASWLNYKEVKKSFHKIVASKKKSSHEPLQTHETNRRFHEQTHAQVIKDGELYSAVLVKKQSRPYYYYKCGRDLNLLREELLQIF